MAKLFVCGNADGSLLREVLASVRSTDRCCLSGSGYPQSIPAGATKRVVEGMLGDTAGGRTCSYLATVN
ncbi:hypothetical protein IG631_04201 [Alternaria alternata]|nr:hypothetical protein IG631_04201 [Alternaria alternata]